MVMDQFDVLYEEGAQSGRVMCLAQLPHIANLFDVDAKYGDVVELDEVLEFLRLRAVDRQGCRTALLTESC